MNFNNEFENFMNSDDNFLDSIDVSCQTIANDFNNSYSQVNCQPNRNMYQQPQPMMQQPVYPYPNMYQQPQPMMQQQPVYPNNMYQQPVYQQCYTQPMPPMMQSSQQFFSASDEHGSFISIGPNGLQINLTPKTAINAINDFNNNRMIMKELRKCMK